jgi:hypothetical protein
MTMSVECAPISTTAHPATAFIRKNGSIARRNRFEDRFLHREVRMMDRVDQRLMLVDRRGDHMDVSFQPRADNAFRLPISGAAISVKILRRYLQNDAVFLQADLRCQLYRVIQVARIDFPWTAEFVQAAAIHAFNRCSADADHCAFDRSLRATLSFGHSDADASVAAP